MKGWLVRALALVPYKTEFRNYSWAFLRRDVLAGLTVSSVAVPQAMAYAVIAGIEPIYGLYTAIDMTALGSLFGSSRLLTPVVVFPAARPGGNWQESNGMMADEDAKADKGQIGWPASTAEESPRSAPPPSVSLRTLAVVFLRLGAMSFDGPAAHVALMEEEIVRRRRWLTPEEFVDLLGATNLIPGPNSTEMAIHVGHRVAGWPGLVVAGVCFILPAALIVFLLAWAYVSFGGLPPVEGVLYGVKPVVIAVIVQALWLLGRSCVKSRSLAALGVIAAVLVVAGFHELAVLFGAGLLLALGRWLAALRQRPGPPALAAGAIPALALANAGGAGAAVAPLGLWPLFLVFRKVGAVLFGSGYVLLAFLRA